MPDPITDPVNQNTTPNVDPVTPPAPAADLPVFLDPSSSPPMPANPAETSETLSSSNPPTVTSVEEPKRPTFMTIEETAPSAALPSDNAVTNTATQPIQSDDSPSFVVNPSSGGSRGGGKKVAALIGIVGLVAATVIGVVAVGSSRLGQSQAWDCEKYNFNVTQEGVVTIVNGSTRNEPIQKAEIKINGTLVATLDVPALTPGQTATLGNVAVPTNGNFTWEVKGTLDCLDGGSYASTTSPTPSPSPSPTPSGSPSPTPSSPPGGTTTTAHCGSVKAYNTSWKELTSADLSKLEAGDKVRFAAKGIASSGNFDKARFTINGTVRSEVTQKRSGTDDFYDEYTIPTGVTTFNVKAEVHHQQQNKWF